MNPIDITIVIFPLILINLTLLLFFASRSKDKLQKIIELKEKYISYLSSNLSILLKKIDEEKLEPYGVTVKMNELLDIYYAMSDFWCDYDYKCNDGILRKLAINFLAISAGWFFLFLTTMPEYQGDIFIFSLLAGAILVWAVYIIGCGICKVTQEGRLLIEFERKLK